MTVAKVQAGDHLIESEFALWMRLTADAVW